MAFQVLLHPKAAEFLEKADPGLEERARAKLSELKGKPKSAGEPLKHSRFWSLRMGDYGAAYELDGKRVIVLFIGHRKKVYDDFSKLL